MSGHWWVIVLAIIGGISISPQGAINAFLGRYVGNLQAAIVSFAVGLLSLIFAGLILIRRYPGDWGRLKEAPLFCYTGGVLGAVIVFTCLIAVPRIGATATVMGILIGQIISSVFIDYYGWFGVPRMPFDTLRIVGLGLLVAALPLVLR